MHFGRARRARLLETPTSPSATFLLPTRTSAFPGASPSRPHTSGGFGGLLGELLNLVRQRIGHTGPVDPIKRRDFVALGEGWIVEDRLHEVVDRHAGRHDRLPDVDQLGSAGADGVNP